MNRTAQPAAKTLMAPLLLVFGAALLWSTGGLFIKWSTLSDYEITFGRSLLAALTVAFFTRREGFGLNGLTVVTSILYAALLFLFVRATKLTTAANAIFLQYTAPIYLLIFEPLLYKEKFRAGDLLTVAACLGGMSFFLIDQQNLTGSAEVRERALEGNLLALCSGLCMAFYFLLLRHPRSQQVNRASSVIYGNLLLVIVTAPLILQSAPQISTQNLISVAWLGVIQIGVAYTLFTLGIARGVRSLDAGIVGYIEPVLNPVWVFLFIGERPSIYALAGGLIIMAAVVAHTLWNGRKAKVAGMPVAD